jgi:FAD/FMN-containing dehydrogenase
VIAKSAESDAWKTSSFWSMHQRAANPAATFQPKSPQEVAIAVLLCQAAGCTFAVKSGGHAAMKGASNADGGLTIDMVNLNCVDLNEDKTVASIGTGNRWTQVFKVLEKDGLAVAGGRAGDVGVGGYTLGGGISFFASAQGWGCDTVRNFELVTASGDIINVNRESYPDLFWALRGGGTNFGVVTRFDYETFPQGDVFAGTLLYEHKHKDATIEAFCTYSFNADIRAATWLIVAWSGGHKLMSALAMYAEPNPDARILKPYLEIPALQSSAKVRSMADMVTEIAEVQVQDHRQCYMCQTFKFDANFVAWLADTYWEEMDTIGEIYESKQGFCMVLQVYTKESIALMRRNGGNCLPLTEEEAPYLNVMIPSAWLHEKDDQVAMDFSNRVLDRAVDEGKKRSLYVDFKYMNYSAESQDVLKGYGKENYDRLEAIAKKYDPDQVFQKLMPGYFKFGGAPV